MDRRKFLRLGSRTLLALPGITLLGSALGYLAHPLLRGDRLTGMVSIGSISSLAPEPELRKIKINHRDAWSEKESFFTVWARLAERGEPIVLSSICPHQRCPVNWVPERERFVCPCHKSRFRIDGSWISGPSEGPLKKLHTDIKDGELLVAIQDLFDL